MRVDTQFRIQSNPELYRYLSENSYWIKYLNRDREFLPMMEDEMKKQYKLTAGDKVEQISHSLEMITSLINLLR